MGTAYLVGAGPGAADLLTVRAVRLLERADVVLHDALVSPEVLALAPRARKIAVGKRAGLPSTDQALISRLLVHEARSHPVVVRLKGGDPSLFARADEELDACRRAGIAVEVVPGISAGFAAAAAAATPLSARGIARSVVFVTASTATDEGADAWADAAAAADSCVIYMGRGQGAAIRAALLARGVAPATPVVAARSVETAQAALWVGTLDGLADLTATAGGPGPVVLLVGAAFGAARSQALPETAASSPRPLRQARRA